MEEMEGMVEGMNGATGALEGFLESSWSLPGVFLASWLVTSRST